MQMGQVLNLRFVDSLFREKKIREKKTLNPNLNLWRSKSTVTSENVYF